MSFPITSRPCAHPNLFIVGLVAVLAAGPIGSILAAAPAAPNRINVLFILADDLRPDAPHVFGNSEVKTPNIDRLAARGSIFPRATCGYPICNVSRSEMFTGRCLVGAGMPQSANPQPKFEQSWTLWPALMQSSGWHTVFSGKWHVAGTPWTDGYTETAGLYSSGGGQGKEMTRTVTPTGRAVTGYTGWTFKDNQNKPLPELGIGLTPDTDIIMTDRAVEAIRRLAGKPFFLHVNYTETHDPLHWPRGMDNHIDYRSLKLPPNFLSDPGFDTGNRHGRDEVIVPAPRKGEDVKKERAIYFTELENLDKQIGRLTRALEEAGELSRTLIIFTSDQGLAMGSHGLMGKQNQYEHTINISLILAGPGIPAGKSLNAQCYLRDLYPTICELTGLAIPASVQGRSLLPVLRGEKTDVYDRIFGYYTGTQRMVRENDGWKLIWYPVIDKFQLFRIPEDPAELHDLSGDPKQRARMKSMQAQILAWQREHDDPLVRMSPAEIHAFSSANGKNAAKKL